MRDCFSVCFTQVVDKIGNLLTVPVVGSLELRNDQSIFKHGLNGHESRFAGLDGFLKIGQMNSLMLSYTPKMV